MDNLDDQYADKSIRIFTEQVALEPDHYPWAKEFIEHIQNSFWTHRLFNFQSDVQDFLVTLTEQERDIIVRCLSTIGQLEISVKKFWAKLGDNLPHPSIIDLGFTMASNEVVHGNAYSNLLKVLGIKDSFEKILELDIIKGRVNYLKKHLVKYHADNKKQFIYSLILFTLIIENTSLFSAFYIISWFGYKKNLLKDTCKQVEYTSREEDIHANVGIRTINQIKQEAPFLFDEGLEQKIIKESADSVNYEAKITEWMLGDYEGEGLSAEIIKNMSMDRLNKALDKIGYDCAFEIDKDLLKETIWFNEQLLGNNHTDFFYSRPSEYSFASQGFEPEDLFEDYV